MEGVIQRLLSTHQPIQAAPPSEHPMEWPPQDTAPGPFQHGGVASFLAERGFCWIELPSTVG